MSIFKRLSLARQLQQEFGSGWLAYRAFYALQMRSGWQRLRYPTMNWASQPLSRFLSRKELTDPGAYLFFRRTEAPPFFFDALDIAEYQPYFDEWDRQDRSPIIEADALESGKLRYFRHRVADVEIPPDWHTNPFTGLTFPASRHWSQIGDFDFGDVKVVWEASRFGFVYDLVRAYWRSKDDRYAELFWDLVLDWQLSNPPWQGPNWKCGQETSFRVMAWCFGFYGFLHAEATTPERLAILAQMIAFSGNRIEANMRYALSQRNNHGISEGLGLWTIGTLFPEFSSSSHWREKGRDVLEQLGHDLIYEDGSFSQHSVNYHRVMLHDYLWCLQLARIQKQPFSKALEAKVALAGTWLYQLQLGGEGQVPYYGQNDGSLILPLDNCDYLDFRPVIQATQYYNSKSRCYESGPWDEDLLWLFGRQALTSPQDRPVQEDFQADIGGYYVLHAEFSAAFVRCATFRDRPGQADMLHVDLWWQSQNIAIDAGTYAYNAEDPWNNPLAATRYHNCVTVDGLDQMNRRGRFLWLPWLHARQEISKESPAQIFSYWQGSHDGYTRLESPVNYRRGILRIGADSWLILDHLMSQASHLYRLHWLVNDWPFIWEETVNTFSINTPKGAYHISCGSTSSNAEIEIIEGNEQSVDGWQAPYYSTRRPAISMTLEVNDSETVLWTLFSPKRYSAYHQGGDLCFQNEIESFLVKMQEREPDLIFTEINGTGNLADRLILANTSRFT